MTLEHIAQLAYEYSVAHEALADSVTALNSEIEALKRRNLASLRQRVRVAAEARASLAEAIRAAPELFENPRMRVLAGVKLGIVKSRGKVEFDDEAAVIERIRRLVPAEQAELLIRVSERVHKPAVYDLSGTDLKRLGIRITDDGDQIVIRPADSEVDKLVEALLGDLTEETVS